MIECILNGDDTKVIVEGDAPKIISEICTVAFAVYSDMPNKRMKQLFKSVLLDTLEECVFNDNIKRLSPKLDSNRDNHSKNFDSAIETLLKNIMDSIGGEDDE